MRLGWRRIGVIAIVVVVALAALNVAGLVRYPGGPLRDRSDDGLFWLDLRPSDQGSSTVGFGPDADWATVGRSIYNGDVTLRNPWPWAATVEAVTPIDPSPGLIVDGFYLSRPGRSSAASDDLDIAAPDVSGIAFNADFSALPAVVPPAGPTPDGDARTLLVLHTDRPGPMTFSALAVDYRIGPATFRAVQFFGLAGCIGPLRAGVTCPSE